MKWLKGIKKNSQPWLTFLSASSASIAEKPDDTAIINAYFATYLQNIVADQINLESVQTGLINEKFNNVCDSNCKHPDKTLCVLSPLKQVL